MDVTSSLGVEGSRGVETLGMENRAVEKPRIPEELEQRERELQRGGRRSKSKAVCRIALMAWRPKAGSGPSSTFFSLTDPGAVVEAQTSVPYAIVGGILALLVFLIICVLVGMVWCSVRQKGKCGRGPKSKGVVVSGSGWQRGGA